MDDSRGDWNRERVLVTGAGGFIGSHLVERLVAEGARVRAFIHYNSLGRCGWLDDSRARDQIEIVVGDILDRDRIRAACDGVESIFHLAALIGIPYSYHAPLSYVRTNAEGTLNVLQAARAADVKRVVHTSTSEVYGSAQYVPIDEAHPLQGQSPYSASKIAADKMAEAFHKSFDLPVLTVRPFNTYGPRQSPRAIVPTIIGQSLFEDSLKLGSLDPIRDLTFVGDTVDGFLAAAACPEAVGRVLNLGTGEGIPIRSLVDLVRDVVGRAPALEVEEQRMRPSASEVSQLIGDNSAMHALTGWQPRTSLEDGIRVTADWIRTHAEGWRHGSYAI